MRGVCNLKILAHFCDLSIVFLPILGIVKRKKPVASRLWFAGQDGLFRPVPVDTLEQISPRQVRGSPKLPGSRCLGQFPLVAALVVAPRPYDERLGACQHNERHDDQRRNSNFHS